MGVKAAGPTFLPGVGISASGHGDDGNVFESFIAKAEEKVDVTELGVVARLTELRSGRGCCGHRLGYRNVW